MELEQLKIVSPQCKTVYDTTWETTWDTTYEKKCKNTWEKKCEYTGWGNKAAWDGAWAWKPKCKQVPKEQCENVPKRVTTYIN